MSAEHFSQTRKRRPVPQQTLGADGAERSRLPAGPAAAGPTAAFTKEGRHPSLQATDDSAKDMAPLHECVSDALQDYFAHLDGQAPVGLYDFVMAEVERPLLKAVMHQVAGNQSRAAEMLGLNRGTLRKKLKQHGLLEN